MPNSRPSINSTPVMIILSAMLAQQLITSMYCHAGCLSFFLFERTAHDVCVSIDITEKYNTISLEGYNQAK
jgi:hypothetical protein